MQVFKTFMKILKTRLTSAILYLVIFMVIAVIMADTAKDNNDYEDYKMSISVIDRDNSAESKRLQDFIFSGNKKVELADDEDEVIDAVYYGRSNYVLYINKDFGDKINAGDFDGLFENFKMPSSYGVQSSAADKAGAVQEKTAFLPDYSFAGSDSAAGTSVSGIAGAAIVAAAAALICGVGGICRHKKRHQS